jgi:acyl carrier protein
MQVLESDVRSIVVEVSGIDKDTDPHADLYLDAGMASFHALQLLIELEERFGVSIPDGDFAEATTIAELTSTLNAALEKHA